MVNDQNRPFHQRQLPVISQVSQPHSFTVLGQKCEEPLPTIERQNVRNKEKEKKKKKPYIQHNGQNENKTVMGI
jgi:hypothetical protein